MELKYGKETPVLILEANSTSIKRVCRSTLAAESNSFLSGVEAAIYVASLLREVMHPGVSLRTLETEYNLKKVLAFTDAKSLESTNKRCRSADRQARQDFGFPDSRNDGKRM